MAQQRQDDRALGVAESGPRAGTAEVAGLRSGVCHADILPEMHRSSWRPSAGPDRLRLDEAGFDSAEESSPARGRSSVDNRPPRTTAVVIGPPVPVRSAS
ncbi:alcohol dehydrogenase [Actinomyces sp. oral taxon 448 str. F0400]|nr:alcohol dehydrogenase [Actinomyces sp. oral taxon 448 str. F0400]